MALIIFKPVYKSTAWLGKIAIPPNFSRRFQIKFLNCLQKSSKQAKELKC